MTTKYRPPVYDVGCFVDEDTPIEIHGGHMVIGTLDRGHITITCLTGDSLTGIASFALRMYFAAKRAQWREFWNTLDSDPVPF